MQLSSIFGLYNDPEKIIDNTLLKAIEGRTPDVDITDEAGESHRMWVVSDEKVLEAVSLAFKKQQIFIADGHHRYETALGYSKQMKEAGHEGYDYVLATLVNLYDEGLVVLPTHRVVKNIKDLDLEQFKSALTEVFNVEEFNVTDDSPEFMTELTQRAKRNMSSVYTLQRRNSIY